MPASGAPGAARSAIRSSAAGRQISSQTPRSIRTDSFTGRGRVYRRDLDRQKQAVVIADGLHAVGLETPTGAGQWMRTDFTFSDPDQSKLGGMPASPGLRQ